MTNGTDNDDLQQLRYRIVDSAYVAYSGLAGLALVFTSLRAARFGGSLILYVTIIFASLLIISAYFRKRINNYFKIYFLIATTSLTIFSGMYNFGLLASATYYILALPVFVSFILSLRAAIVILIVDMLIYIAFAVLYCTSALTRSIDTVAWFSNWPAWLLDVSILTFCSWSLLALGQQFLKTLHAKYVRIEEQNLKLANNESKYRLLFETSNDAIVLIKDYKFFDCNQKTFEMFACGREYLIGSGPHQLSPEIQPDGSRSEEKSKMLFDLAYNGLAQLFEWRHLRPDGTYFDASIGLNMVVLNDDRYYQAVLRDITAQKEQDAELCRYREQLEILVNERTAELESTNDELISTNEELSATNEELYYANDKIQNQHHELEEYIKQLKLAQSQIIQSEKMASLGILTSGVAHEINNPLNFIMGAQVGLENYFAETEQRNDPRIAILMDSLNVGLNRAAGIVASLSQFSKDSGNKIQQCNICEIIDNCLLVLSSQMNASVSIIKAYRSDMIFATGNIGDLHQVFMNVITNAYQAINKTGSITIQVDDDKPNITILITDTGNGMDEETMAHIFDPFFTTKEPGKGTGLGMSIAYNIITEHGGTIRYMSKPERGTTALITLPITKKADNL